MLLLVQCISLRHHFHILSSLALCLIREHFCWPPYNHSHFYDWDSLWFYLVWETHYPSVISKIFCYHHIPILVDLSHFVPIGSIGKDTISKYKDNWKALLERSTKRQQRGHQHRLKKMRSMLLRMLLLPLHYFNHTCLVAHFLNEISLVHEKMSQISEI